MSRPPFEVADVVRKAGSRFRERYRASLTWPQVKVLNAIARCRTAALGGHRDQCSRCGHQVISYNSCRNRHCPKCQTNARDQWLDKRQQELLPVSYFHLVFSVPHALVPLMWQNKRRLFALLFSSSAAALLEVAADPKPPTRVLWRVPATRRREELRCLSTHAVSAGLGRLCQTALWWTGTRPSLPGPLHPSRCHLQPPAALGLRRRGRLPLEGLRAWQQAPYHDSLSGGVPAPFPTACFTQRLSPYPLLRLAGQPRTQEPAPTLSSSTQPATARNRSIVFKPTCHLAVPTLPGPDVRHRTTHRCPDPFAGMQTCMCL